jgi:hypothetical protein
VAGPDSLAAAVDSMALAAILDGLLEFAESKRLYHRALKIYRRETNPKAAKKSPAFGSKKRFGF